MIFHFLFFNVQGSFITVVLSTALVAARDWIHVISKSK